MSAREPTRQQLSSRLQYQSHVPAFLQKFQNKVQGITDEDEDEPQYYDDGSGRPPIPVRAAIPERPDDDPGSVDEDDVDERPQVVVLKKGKHLTEREAENERRKGAHHPTELFAFSDKITQRKGCHYSLTPTRKLKMIPRRTRNQTRIRRRRSKKRLLSLCRFLLQVQRLNNSTSSSERLSEIWMAAMKVPRNHRRKSRRKHRKDRFHLEKTCSSSLGLSKFTP
jgi:hypothetical protein